MSGTVSAQETIGERWKKENYQKIDKETADRKNKAREEAENAIKWGWGSKLTEAEKAKRIEKADAKIDAEAKQNKKDIDDIYEKIGPAKNRPYKGKK